jgi:hypothetical protein
MTWCPGFWELRDRPNVLFLTYEQMKQDLPAAVRRIAALLAIDLTPGELDAVVQQAGFTQMKQLRRNNRRSMITGGLS